MRWTVLIPLLAVVPAAAQETAELTDAAAAAIAEFYNRPSTVRVEGQTRIPTGVLLDGDVASIGGPVIVAGTVRGDLVVINGDVVIEPAGRIEGSVTVVGGAFTGPAASVVGRVVVHREPLRFRREGEGIVALGPARLPGLLRAGRETAFGRTEFRVTVDGSYNRVEGLPITFGPRLELGHSNPTVLDGRLTYRTQSGLRIHREEFGHLVRVEQYLGGHRGLRLGAAAYRTIDPIERNGLSDTENSLATFVMHRDYRDHYERRGWSAFLLLNGRVRPYEAGLEYRDEAHFRVPPANPWSLLRNQDPWRPQPQAASGDIRLLRGWLRWDTRNAPEPSTGWLVDVEFEQGLEGELAVNLPCGSPMGLSLSCVERSPIESEYTTVRLDARRYVRLGPRSRLALRALAAGSPDDGQLPPQRQHTLGGDGTLPGYSLFRFDCGARAVSEAYTDTTGFFPYYGCDRLVLFQAEYSFALLRGPSLGTRLGLDFDLVTTPELVLFGDAGRAWIEPESLTYRSQTGPDDFIYDAGFGLRLGRLGLYLAVPLSDGADGVNFFVRLGPRL